MNNMRYNRTVKAYTFTRTHVHILLACFVDDAKRRVVTQQLEAPVCDQVVLGPRLNRGGNSAADSDKLAVFFGYPFGYLGMYAHL